MVLNHNNIIIPFTTDKENGSISEYQIDICPICRDPENLIIDLCKYGIGYHRECWDNWLATNPSSPTCPTCRAITSNKRIIDNYRDEVWLEFINEYSNNMIRSENAANKKIIYYKICIATICILAIWLCIYFIRYF